MMINRPKEHGYLEPRHDLQNPSFGISKRVSRVFGRRVSLSSNPSRASVPLSLIEIIHRPSTGLKDTPSAPPSKSPGTTKRQAPVSPTHEIASILNSMYASPVNRGPVDSHPTWKRDQSSLRLNGHAGGSISILSQARNSVDSKSVAVEQSTPSSSRTHSSFESPMNTDSRGMHSVASISSGSTGSSKGKKNISNSSHESGSTSRVVGRGGSGSRLRIVAPQPENINLVTVRQEHPPPLIRPSGRGGLASRPKPLDAPVVPPKDNLKSTKPAESDKPILIRPSGRGGLGSRPKPLGSSTSPTIFKLLKKNKNRIDKGKRKAPEMIRAIHPIPPNRTYQISNGSTTTLSTIHFVDETGEPSTPFFPDDRSIDSNYGDGDDARPISSPLSGSSIYSSDHSSKTTVLSGQTAQTTEEYCNESRPTTPIDHRQRNLFKLTRTLGSLPDDALFPGQRQADNTSPPKKDKNTKVFRRASISMTSLTSMFGRSSGRGCDSVATSSMTDDLHHFGLEDDLSESWGHASSSSICEPPASPIMFSPPSPAYDPPPNPVLVASGLVGGQVKPLHSADTLSVASSTLTHSNSFTSSQRSSTRASSHSRQHSSSASILSDFPAESNKSIWLIPVKDDDELDIRPHRHGNIVNISDKPQNWSGEWNGDIHQVIKSLRLL